MNKAVVWLLWCFVFVLPWEELVHLPLLGSVPHLVGIVASAMGVLHILARRRIRPPSWFHVFAVLFVLWAGASAFWSIDPETTLTRFMTYFQLLLLVWLIWELAGSSQRLRALLQAYVLGACVAAAANICTYLAGVPLDDPARVTSLNQDPNELGLILVLGLPMAWYLGLARPQGRMAWIWQLYLPLGVTAILLTASRGAFLAALVALTIIPATLGRVRLRTKAAFYALAVGSLALASSVVPAASLERIGSARADIEAGYFGGRRDIWIAGLAVARDHPLGGVGAGAFGVAVQPTLRGERASHQVFLAIVVEQGIVGLFLFLAMVAAAIKPLRHLPLLQRRFAIVLLLALAVGSLSLEWDHRKEFWFVLGVLAAHVALRPARTGSPAASQHRGSAAREWALGGATRAATL